MYGDSSTRLGGYVDAASAPNAPPKVMPRLDGPAAHLEEMTKGLQEYSVRLARVADRFLGSIPEAVEKDGNGQIRAACVASRYEAVADTYASLLRRLGTAVERLETL